MKCILHTFVRGYLQGWMHAWRCGVFRNKVGSSESELTWTSNRRALGLEGSWQNFLSPLRNGVIENVTKEKKNTLQLWESPGDVCFEEILRLIFKNKEVPTVCKRS